MTEEKPWQIKIFDRTLKKKQRYFELKKYLGTPHQGSNCLLVTCGDNNGAMNYLLRQLGGTWSFADLEDTCLDEMRTLLGQEVSFVQHDQLPYDDGTFDVVVTIDVHEHLDDPIPFCNEVNRVAKPGSKIIFTVPNGDESKPVVKLKHAVGMTPDEYGHSRVGIRAPELREMMKGARIEPTRHSTFSKFFTELLELTINFVYVKIVAKRSEADVEKGQIAPATQTQVESVNKLLILYSLIYPFYFLISQLDRLLVGQEGYVVVAEGTNR